MDPVTVHEGDDLPTLYMRVYDQDAECYVDLSPVTTVVTAKFRAQDDDTVLQTVVCDKVYGGVSGHVKMVWPSTALDIDYGRYEIELSVSFNGSIQTANSYYWDGSSSDTADTLPIRIKEDF